MINRSDSFFFLFFLEFSPSYSHNAYDTLIRNYDDRLVGTSRECSMDHNNCWNLAQSAKRIPFEGLRARTENCRNGLRDWSEGVGKSSHAQASCQTRSTPLPATPSQTFSTLNLLPTPLTKSLLSPPCSTRCGRRDVRLGSANLRETSMPELVHGTEPSGRWGFIVFVE